MCNVIALVTKSLINCHNYFVFSFALTVTGLTSASDDERSMNDDSRRDRSVISADNSFYGFTLYFRRVIIWLHNYGSA